MKLCWPIFFLSFYTCAYASVCRVYGISDSPQELNCYIHLKGDLEPFKIRCENGDYQISWQSVKYKVKQAYHEEVEVGPMPLLFDANSLILRAVFFHSFGQAKLSTNEGSFDGICFYK